jgi:hypothetical protein
MSEETRNDAKVQNPSTYFNEPHEVVVDSSLSKAQKVEALGTLEQDARQLAEASSEGMGGGERGKLHEVLVAGGALALPVADAYATVLQDLRSRQERHPAIDTRVLLEQAIAALDGLVASYAQPSAGATVTAP